MTKGGNGFYIPADKRILVVDDEDEFRRVVVLILRKAGEEVSEADNGVSIFDLAKAHSPNLTISDGMMYSGSGFMLREFLKHESGTVNIDMDLPGLGEKKLVKVLLEINPKELHANDRLGKNTPEVGVRIAVET